MGDQGRLALHLFLTRLSCELGAENVAQLAVSLTRSSRGFLFVKGLSEAIEQRFRDLELTEKLLQVFFALNCHSLLLSIRNYCFVTRVCCAFIPLTQVAVDALCPVVPLQVLS